jgi:hypothetical protein
MAFQSGGGMRLDAYLRNRASESFAKKLAAAIRIICSVPGAKGTRATPGAPPRRITGRLYRSIRAQGSKVYVHAPYAKYLEDDAHKFVERSVMLALALARLKTGEAERHEGA